MKKPTQQNTHIYKVQNFNMKEGNILFNDTLNTFYLCLYGISNFFFFKQNKLF